MLDIGCGTGEFTRNVLLPWSKPCRKMVAVDALPGMIEYAKTNYPHPNISYAVLDAASRDISNFLKKHGKFDRVYCFYCLHWIKDQEVALANVGKLLKDDGECLFLFVSQFVFYDLWQEMASMERWRDIIGDPLEIFPKSWNRDPKPSLKDVETSVKEMVADAGMDTISCTVYPATPCVFKNAQGVLGYLATNTVLLLGDVRNGPYRIQDFKPEMERLRVLRELASAGAYQMNHVWMLRLHYPAAKQRLVEAKELRVKGGRYLIFDPVSTGVSVKLHWVSYVVPNCQVRKELEWFGKVADISRDYFREKCFVNVQTNTRIVRMKLKDEISVYDVPHEIRVEGCKVLVFGSWEGPSLPSVSSQGTHKEKLLRPTMRGMP
ncbi:hypothetical protein HPB47_017610 [Ixodes persulcatus]|uniref:Uncharacterized protein n=1 Tax=Ixodes persulcatus TaxID=34615 RepID=A0AC60QQF6_IXOPE|nr:hypothetical protein HPB47_017610 [Ixodes persulcatus]